MPHLGELAAAKAEATGEPISFDWHGRRIRCRPEIPSLPLLELAATGADVAGTPSEEDVMVVGAAFYRFLEAIIDPADWLAFKRASTTAGDGPAELLPLVSRLAEATTGRPTGPSSVSPPGPPPTTDGSTGTSPPPEGAHWLRSADVG